VIALEDILIIQTCVVEICIQERGRASESGAGGAFSTVLQLICTSLTWSTECFAFALTCWLRSEENF